MEHVPPLEEVDPELGEMFRQIANKELPYRINNEKIYDSRTGGLVPDPDLINVGRNDKCPCESGKKYKKCCGFN